MTARGLRPQPDARDKAGRAGGGPLDAKGGRVWLSLVFAFPSLSDFCLPFSNSFIHPASIMDCLLWLCGGDSQLGRTKIPPSGLPWQSGD